MANVKKLNSSKSGQLLVWGVFAVLLVVAPMIFNKGAALSVLSQIGTMMIFALSFNMLLGQGGMLSFGHAVYSGLGGFFAIHTMNLATEGSLPVPVTLIPLVGGVAGMFFGALFGYVITKKSGTTFSMITLGICEMIHAASEMFPGFFGGEGGIQSNRVIGSAFLGITYGPQIQVYYLIAFWLFVSTVGMFAFTQTPLGRIINAVRDNPERVEFVGYDTQWVRYLTLILSGFFAGIAGGLSAINFEFVSAETLTVIGQSTNVLICTFIGGTGYFFGPVIGAVIGVFLTVVLANYTHAWQLYLGVIFIVIVMFAPGGIASLLMANVRMIKYGKFKRVLPGLLILAVGMVVGLCGFVIMVEMMYHLTLDAASGSVMQLGGYEVDTGTAVPWAIGVVLVLVGAVVFRFAKGPFHHTWGEATTEIEDQIRKAQA